MSHYIAKLIKTQSFQDFSGVIRGLDRVKLGLFQDIDRSSIIRKVIIVHSNFLT